MVTHTVGNTIATLYKLARKRCRRNNRVKPGGRGSHGLDEGQAAPTRIDDAKFGETPLAQTVAAAAAMRRLSSLLLSLEQPHPTVDAMLAKFAEWESELARRGSAGQRAPDRRASTTIRGGSISTTPPTSVRTTRAFPSTPFDHLDADKAGGRVVFPLVYEGPPGLVHGGFLAVFFDCVIQHHSCVTGLSGKTRSLAVTFRRPTPVLTELRFDIVRSPGRAGHHVDGAAAARRRGALHRRGQHLGVAAGQADRHLNSAGGERSPTT